MCVLAQTLTLSKGSPVNLDRCHRYFHLRSSLCDACQAVTSGSVGGSILSDLNVDRLRGNLMANLHNINVSLYEAEEYYVSFKTKNK